MNQWYYLFIFFYTLKILGLSVDVFHCEQRFDGYCNEYYNGIEVFNVAPPVSIYWNNILITNYLDTLIFFSPLALNDPSDANSYPLVITDANETISLDVTPMACSSSPSPSYFGNTLPAINGMTYDPADLSDCDEGLLPIYYLCQPEVQISVSCTAHAIDGLNYIVGYGLSQTDIINIEYMSADGYFGADILSSLKNQALAVYALYGASENGELPTLENVSEVVVSTEISLFMIVDPPELVVSNETFFENYTEVCFTIQNIPVGIKTRFWTLNEQTIEDSFESIDYCIQLPYNTPYNITVNFQTCAQNENCYIAITIAGQTVVNSIEQDETKYFFSILDGVLYFDNQAEKYFNSVAIYALDGTLIQHNNVISNQIEINPKHYGIFILKLFGEQEYSEKLFLAKS